MGDDVRERSSFSGDVNQGFVDLEQAEPTVSGLSASERQLFVFGSLAEGMPHFRKIESYVETAIGAAVCGTVYRLPSGVPVLLEEGTQTISGSLVTLRSHDVLFALLDEIQGFRRLDPGGSLSERRLAPIVLENGTSVSANIYYFNPLRLPRGARLIEDANWRKSLEQHPPLFQCLTDRQKAYIRKLGSCSGREIVPIDLSLYRELMHLEVVVDKGRRLALTSLGQELYRLLT